MRLEIQNMCARYSTQVLLPYSVYPLVKHKQPFKKLKIGNSITYSFREGRYLLILTENFAALPRVKQLLIEQDSEEPYVIFGSSFPKDQLFTQVKVFFIVKCLLAASNLMLYVCHPVSSRK